jgi:hypothetical protein
LREEGISVLYPVGTVEEGGFVKPDWMTNWQSFFGQKHTVADGKRRQPMGAI